MKHEFILPFRKVDLGDIARVGGKNASLGEMIQNLSAAGIRVPDGFAITADAYRFFLKANRLDSTLEGILKDLNVQNLEQLASAGQRLRDLIRSAAMPPELRDAIVKAYSELSAKGGNKEVAVRSSATAEDLPEASFAGQQETYLNVLGAEALIETCKRCFASLFTDRAISYRTHHGFDHMKVALSIGVQTMVRSDLGSAGVMFTIDTESGFQDAILINAAYGLGENVVQGTVNPDEFLIFKTTLKSGFKPVLHRAIGNKETKLVYDLGGNRMTKNVPVPANDRTKPCISDDEALQLARWAVQIEEHYSRKRGTHTPMDLEWAKDGKSGALYILQARPETVQSRKALSEIESFELKSHGATLAKGRAVGEKVAVGPVRVILTAADIGKLREGEVLVTDKTDPDWEPAMKKAAAIVTNRGGRTCHAAIVSRELGLAAIVGTENATAHLKDGDLVTVSCAEGEVGRVYTGKAEFSVRKVSLSELPRTKTKVMMNLAQPTQAMKLSFLPNDGVGLARIEFIIGNEIGMHPQALVDFDRLADDALKSQIDARCEGYKDKSQYFVDKLAQGVGHIAAAFYPKDVIVRMSDFKTNEYANLLGGHLYEPKEENPMLGFRGASRYTHEKYREGFALECRAMRKVREEMGLTNLKLMIPFCRTVEEGKRVVAEMEKHGLKRGAGGLEIYVMCEIPSNVLLADEFSEVFDGFSIGSNDLTQLVLGVDRDSQIVAPLFNERNPAVKKMIASVIASAKSKGRKIGICGQAPSDYPDFAEFLVQQGIDSISLNPDAIVKTLATIAAAEKKKT